MKRKTPFLREIEKRFVIRAHGLGSQTFCATHQFLDCLLTRHHIQSGQDTVFVFCMQEGKFNLWGGIIDLVRTKKSFMCQKYAILTIVNSLEILQKRRSRLSVPIQLLAQSLLVVLTRILPQAVALGYFFHHYLQRKDLRSRDHQLVLASLQANCHHLSFVLLSLP